MNHAVFICPLRGLRDHSEKIEGFYVINRHINQLSAFASDERDQTYLVINQQETGNSSEVSEPTTNIRVMCEGDGIQRRGEVARSVVATGGCRTTAEDHAKRDFESSVGAAGTGIWQAWWGRGRRGIFVH